MVKEYNTKELYVLTLKLALPIMIQTLISTFVNTADTIMLGYVGQTAMAAASLANQYTFVLFCAFYGMATATSVMVAQYWGKGDKKTIERIIGLSARYAILCSLLFTIISFLFPKQIMMVFTDSPETIALGAEYLRAISISILFMAVTEVYISALRSIGKVVFPSVVSVVSLCVNVTLNATFIFGLFGMPALGVLGVAIGTVIARGVALIMSIIYSIKCEVKFRPKYIFKSAGVLNKDFIKISMPATGNDLIWALATTVFTAILGHMGNDIVAANAVAVMVADISAIAMRGFSGATTIVIGQTLGSNKINETKTYAKKLLFLVFNIAVVGCIVIVALRPVILGFYSDKLSELALYYLGIMIYMTTYRMIGDGINTTLICGCFRGGGDTTYGLIMDFIMMWIVIIPIMLFVAYVLRLPPIWVYFVMTLDETIKMPIFFTHFFKYKWLKNITREL